jgi:RNA polymerase sigma factor (TIGR02999 family)
MSDVTQILSAIEQGDPHAAEQLLPLVYDALRRLAAAKLAQEKPGHTLQATALVHEAYLRLVGSDKARHWDSRGHFFAAAAEAMRRILIDNARRKKADKAGGGWQRQELIDAELLVDSPGDELFAVDEALSRFAVAPQTVAGEFQEPLAGRDVAGNRPLQKPLQDRGRFVARIPRSPRCGRQVLGFSLFESGALLVPIRTRCWPSGNRPHRMFPSEPGCPACLSDGRTSWVRRLAR